MKENQKIASNSDLAEQLTKSDLRAKSVRALEDCLDAKDEYWDAIRKAVVVKPDFKTILSAALGILAYTDGKPVERREIVTRTMTTLESLRAQAKSSPELRKAIAELLDEKPVAQVVAKPA